MITTKVLDITDDITDITQPERVNAVATKSASKSSANKKASFTAKDLLESSLVGLWASRKDLADSSKAARKIWEKEQKRRH